MNVKIWHGAWMLQASVLLFSSVSLLSSALLLSSKSSAQTFPNRPVTMVVPYPPGASTDQLARLVQPKLAAGLGQPVIIEHRPGVSGAENPPARPVRQ